MSVRFSTALVNAMQSKQAAVQCSYTASTIAGVNGSPPTLTDSANGFITAGFRAGDVICLFDGNNNTTNLISAVAAGTLTLTNAITAYSAGSSVHLVTFTGGSLLDLLENGVLAIYSGSQPATADTTEGSSTLLLLITVGSGTFVAGAPANGLNFANPAVAGVLSKTSAIWSGNGIATGTAAWFRFYSNAYHTGGDSSYLYPSFDGSIGIAGSGADLIVATTSIATSAPYTVDQFQITLPQHV